METHRRLKEVIAKHFLVTPESLAPDSGPVRGDIELWDSFGHITLILAIEEEFQVKFKSDEIPNLTSVDKIEERLNAYTAR